MFFTNLKSPVPFPKMAYSLVSVLLFFRNRCYSKKNGVVTQAMGLSCTPVLQSHLASVRKSEDLLIEPQENFLLPSWMSGSKLENFTVVMGHHLLGTLWFLVSAEYDLFSFMYSKIIYWTHIVYQQFGTRLWNLKIQHNSET